MFDSSNRYHDSNKEFSMANSDILWLLLAVFIIMSMFLLYFVHQLLKEKRDKPLPTPPIITIEEVKNFMFESGSASISEAFKEALDKKHIPYIMAEAEKNQCDTIEVIGHTDEQRLTMRTSIFDDRIKEFIYNSNPISPASNAELGFMRAWAIINVLKNWSAANRRTPYVKYYYGYSAANMIKNDGNLSSQDVVTGDIPERRRIEIRLVRSSNLKKQLQADVR